MSSKNGAVQLYLLGYNTFCLLGWSYVLVRLIEHQLDSSSTSWAAYLYDLYQKSGFTSSSTVDKMLSLVRIQAARATTAEEDLGYVVQWVQSIAVLEVFHVLFGLVRSSLGTTAMQVASRLWAVWGVLGMFHEVSTSPIYATMILAWSLSEIVRFSHYICLQQNIKISIVEYTRYSFFYVLYPLGAGSEAFLMYLASQPAGEKYGPVAQYGLLALFSSWFLGLFFMMSHMHRQRQKHLRRSSKEQKKEQ